MIYYLFFILLLFLKFYFQFCLFILVKKLQNFLFSFILCIRDFIKQFWKIMEHFSKKYRHFKSKIHHKFHRLQFAFFFLAFWYSFFPISPIQTCQKILNIFVVRYCTDYRIYQIIFIKKNRDTLNTKLFLNSIVYYFLF